MVRVRVKVRIRVRVRVNVKVRVSFSVCKSTSGLHCAPAPKFSYDELAVIRYRFILGAACSAVILFSALATLAARVGVRVRVRIIGCR